MSTPSHEKFVAGLVAHTERVTVLKDRFPRTGNAYILTYETGKAVTTIRFVLDDVSGAGLAITNMTTLPESETRKGYGTVAVRNLVNYAKTCGISDIRAVQVQPESEGFWVRSGFTPEGNPTNDFRFIS